MNNFQQNLLVVVALGLCGLCVYQWHGQTQQRTAIENLNQVVYERNVAIQGYTNSIKTMDQHIARLDAEVSILRQTAATNELLIVSQKREVNELQFQNEALTNQIAEYKNAVAALESKLKESYDGIKKQNEAIRELADQRDEFVKKFNDSVKDRNDIVAKYNDLAAQVEKLQGGNKK